MARRPVRGSATKQDTGKSCPFCRFPIKERDEVVACGECHSTHHDDCWEENGGCAVPDCAGGPAEEVSAGSGGGSHIPPVAGPSKKKVTLDPRPAMRRRKRDRTRKKTGTAANAADAAPERASNVQFWLAGTIVAFVVILGVILISNSFGDRDPVSEASCEPGTGVNGVRCLKNGKLPNWPEDQLQRQISRFVKNWYRSLGNFDFDSAWNDLSPRVRKQINARGGRSQWEDNMEGMARYLKPDGATVTLEKKIYPDDGVQTVNVQNMPYTKGSDRCQERVGVTWVAWDPKNKRWWYEPGLGVTSERAADWKYQQVRVLSPKCK